MGQGRGKNRRRVEPGERVKSLTSVASAVVAVLVRVVAAAVIVGALVVGGRYAHQWATTSATFSLKNIVLEGTSRADQVDLCKLAGLVPGQNLFKLDVDQARRAMEAHPWVRRVDITRHFPSSVAVKVEEHEPAALVALGDLYLLDREGEPFKKLTAGDALDLPLVTGITRERYMEKPEEAGEAFRHAMSIADRFEEFQKDSKERVSELRLSGNDVVVITSSGTEVRLGEDATAEKLERLGRVHTELRRRGLSAEVIHLDNRVRPGWVTVKVSTPLSERKRESMQ